MSKLKLWGVVLAIVGIPSVAWATECPCGDDCPCKPACHCGH